MAKAKKGQKKKVETPKKNMMAIRRKNMQTAPWLRIIVTIISLFFWLVVIFSDFEPPREEVVKKPEAEMVTIERKVPYCEAPKNASSIEIPKHESTRRQDTSFNVHAVWNKTNTQRLADWGIPTASWIRDIDSYLICEDGRGCNDYPEFKERMMDFFQPKNEVCVGLDDKTCEEMRLRNTGVQMYLFAAGYGQVLFFHHCKHLGSCCTIPNKSNWKTIDWDQNLRVLFAYVNDVNLQHPVVRGVIRSYAKSKGPDSADVAAAYYSNHGMGGMLGYVDEVFHMVKREVIRAFQQLSPFKVKVSSSALYKHRRAYGRGVSNCFEKRTGRSMLQKSGNEYTEEDIETLRQCIFARETGGAFNNFTGRSKENCEATKSKWKKRGFDLKLFCKGDSPEPQDDPNYTAVTYTIERERVTKKQAEEILKSEPSTTIVTPDTKPSPPQAPTPAPTPETPAEPTPKTSADTTPSSVTCKNGELCMNAGGREICIPPTIPCKEGEITTPTPEPEVEAEKEDKPEKLVLTKKQCGDIKNARLALQALQKVPFVDKRKCTDNPIIVKKYGRCKEAKQWIKIINRELPKHPECR